MDYYSNGTAVANSAATSGGVFALVSVGILGLLMMAFSIWTLVMVIKYMVRAAKAEEWGWCVGIFFGGWIGVIAYYLTHKDAIITEKALKRNGGMANRGQVDYQPYPPQYPSTPYPPQYPSTPYPPQGSQPQQAVYPPEQGYYPPQQPQQPQYPQAPQQAPQVPEQSIYSPQAQQAPTDTEQSIYSPQAQQAPTDTEQPPFPRS